MRRRWKRFVASGRVRMIAIVAIALVAGSFVEFRSRSADATRNSWQAVGTVFVAREPIDVGASITPDRVIVTPAPALLTPVDAVSSIAGATAARPIGRGEILTSRAIVGPTSAPEQAWRWIAIPVDPVATPKLARDDRVDLVGLDPFGAAASVIATSVRVIDLGQKTVVVEIDEVALPRIAGSVASGLIIVVRAPN